jgi:hypothetical protein
MSSQQKFYLSFSLLVLFLGYASFIGMSYKKEQLSQQVITDVPVLSSGNTSSTGITLSASGSHQSGSVSPSSTGTANKFKKPNTEWKSRTLSGITYVFGEGNPKEVALDINEIKELIRQCEITPGNQDRICREGSAGYVTPELEIALQNILYSSLWDTLINECGDLSDNPKYSEFVEKITHSRNINDYLSIDQSTGRKELDTVHINNILNSIEDVGSTSDSAMNGNRGLEAQYIPCFENTGKILYRMLSNLNYSYTSNISYAVQNENIQSH